jgi:Tfp pilus assembly protein PilN
MIEINLLPGATRKGRGRGTGFSLKSITAGVASRIRDPYMIMAVVGVLVAVAAVGGMHLTQSQTASALTEREAAAVRDSARFAVVLAERRKAEAKRDSVLRQLAVIRAIDNDRYVWSHILDEVSRALPPYTWLKSINQTSQQVAPTPAQVATDPAKPDTTKKKDPVRVTDPLLFRIIGHTVDIQALTRFMKLLETSPFLMNVQLGKSQMVMLDGREVTEFQLDAEYERPDKSVITTTPVSLSVR